MPTLLIVGGTRGLGASLIKQYTSDPPTGSPWTIYATTRSSMPPKDNNSESSSTKNRNVHWLTNIDLSAGPSAAKSLADQIVAKRNVYDDGVAEHGTSELTAGSKGMSKLNTVIITAGYFATEDYGKLDQDAWDAEVKMYTLSSVAPVFLVKALDEAGLFIEGSVPTKVLDSRKDNREEVAVDDGAVNRLEKASGSGGMGTKIVLVTSESGSITLRHEQEGGGNFGHHGSKAASNMVGKQLSLDLRPRGVGVVMVHPGFMRTEMTKGVGFDKFWDEGGAVEPDVAASSLMEWVEGKFNDLGMSGRFWAPRGTGDIGNWGVVFGEKKKTDKPVEVPW